MKRFFQTLAFVAAIVGSETAMAGAPLEVTEEGNRGLAAVLRQITPAVTYIEATGRVGPAANASSKPRPKVGRFRANATIAARHDQSASGSGVIIDASAGLIVTNSHVVGRADTINVTLVDGRRFDAELIGSDPDTDVALIKVKASDLTAVQIADSALEVGETVLAIGNPLLLGQTVTSGIVSGLHRSNIGIERYEDFIQTDAAIYPGNSGGALVNIRGQLVGINTAFIGAGKGNPGLGFAIPWKMVRAIVDQMLEYGEVRHGSLGVTLQDSTAPLLHVATQAAQRNGAVVAKVDRQSTAEQAGLRSGDLVMAIDGLPVQNASHLRASLAVARIGEAAELAVLREGRPIIVRATVARMMSK